MEGLLPTGTRAATMVGIPTNGRYTDHFQDSVFYQGVVVRTIHGSSSLLSRCQLREPHRISSVAEDFLCGREKRLAENFLCQ